MNELKKTLIFCAAAVVLSAASVFVDPGTITPEIFDDQGEPFFAGFSDALAPKVIEIIEVILEIEAIVSTGTPVVGIIDEDAPIG